MTTIFALPRSLPDVSAPMAISTTSSSKIQTLNTSSLFVSSFQSFASSYAVPPPPPPPSFKLLSAGCPLPPVPSDFPPPKLIPGTRFVVDGFRFAGDFSVSYFLSHFHSDHYAGLGPSWCRGVVFCSPTTARLLISVLKVPPSFVVSIPLSERVVVDAWEVVAVDANHCPGAVQFLFKKCQVESGRPQTLRYVHTGDFRYSESMTSNHFLREFVGADAVFLDTTYCNPKFVFPSQEESVEYVVNTIKMIEDHNNKGLKEPVGFFIATYVIGKEKILLEIARRLNCLLHVDGRKMEILSLLGFGASGVFTEDATTTHVHVIGWNLLGETWPFFRPNFSKMNELMLERGYTRAVGFVATGWMYETKRDGFAVKTKDSLEIHLVPYSEHSNYEELREYVRFLRPKHVIPTVGGDIDKVDSKHALTLRTHFAGLVDETANKHDFLMAFRQKSESVQLRDESHVATETYSQETFEEMVIQQVAPEKHSDTHHSDSLSNVDINAAVDELKSCLPSWATKNQLLYLLERSNGDIVGAVSEFFEHETELYKQSTDSNSSSSCYQVNVDAKLNSLATFRVTQDIPDSGLKSFIHQAKIPTNRVPGTKTPPSAKKRGLSSGKKSKKKGKSLSKLPSGGSRQSTITNFFGKVASNSSCESISVTAADDKHLKDNVFEGCAKLDHFLQIINDGMPRSSAASLLQRASGSIDVAVDMYYNNNPKSELEQDPTKDVTEAINLNNCSGESSYSSEGKTNGPILYVQGSAKEHRNLPNVSLPLEKYLPVEHACWKAGEPAPYLHLARTFDLVEQEKGKIKTTLMLCNMFRSLLALSPDDVLPAVYLCTNKIAADHENMELNIGGSLVIAALEEACGRRINGSRIKEMYKLSGDLGDVAQELRQSQRLLAPPGTLSIRHLFTSLRNISTMTGTGSSLQKKNGVLRLVHSCREMEIKFLVRTLVRNLRIGAMMKTILPAIAQATVLNNYQLEYVGIPESLKIQLQGISAEVAEAYNILPNLDLLIPSILKKGTEFSASMLTMVSGTPIPPMLAKITNGVTQVLKLFAGKAFTCEYKYDGQRAQIHRLADGSVRVFSRKMKESTSRFPDLVNTIKELCRHDVTNFILDAEVVAVDRKNGSKIKSFQELSSRERGNKESSIPMDGIKVDICIFIFDIMLCNGERLLELPLRQRRKYMKDLFYEKAGYMEFAREITVEADESNCCDQSTLSKLNLFFEDACNFSCEGIMVKTLDVEARYSASKRSDAWLKVKRDYLEGSGESLDLVPIGAWYGNGRKAGWYSPFLMACYNPDTEEFQSVCRVMSGFSDSFYIEMKEFFSGDKLLAKKPAYYQTDESPPLWFQPELVWEIRSSDLTLSPVHHAALGFVHPSRGISMRLPRFVRSLPDRNPEDCSTAADVAFMYNSQTRKMNVDGEDI